MVLRSDWWKHRFSLPAAGLAFGLLITLFDASQASKNLGGGLIVLWSYIALCLGPFELMLLRPRLVLSESGVTVTGLWKRSVTLPWDHVSGVAIGPAGLTVIDKDGRRLTAHGVLCQTRGATRRRDETSAVKVGKFISKMPYWDPDTRRAQLKDLYPF